MSGRIRTIKPEWLEDEALGRAGDVARVLSVALILMSDDHGRGRAADEYVASQAWPYAPSESLAKAREGLASLSAMGFIRLYSVGGQRYFEIVNWAKHQRVDKPSKPRIPAPREQEDQSFRDTPEAHGKPRETLATIPEVLAPDPDPIPRSQTTIGITSVAPDFGTSKAVAAAELEAWSHITDGFSSRRVAAGGASWRRRPSEYQFLEDAIAACATEAKRTATTTIAVIDRSFAGFFGDPFAKRTGWDFKRWAEDPCKWLAVATSGPAAPSPPEAFTPSEIPEMTDEEVNAFGTVVQRAKGALAR